MTATAASAPATANRLLAGLSGRELQRLNSHLEVIPLATGDVLYERGKRLGHVIFPTRGIVVNLVTMNDGSCTEAGMIGREGTTGLAAFLGADSADFSLVVQTPGEAVQLPLDVFQSESERSTTFGRLLRQYADVFLAQVSQTAACNRLHRVEERCGRWLLMTHDRVDGNEFPMTHQLMARMLGVRRAGVTEACGLLQQAGAIHNSRGRVKVMDRRKLEARSCECYRVIKAKFDKVLK
jgi:CRP-like cAMP-binding protein